MNNNIKIDFVNTERLSKIDGYVLLAASNSASKTIKGLGTFTLSISFNEKSTSILDNTSTLSVTGTIKSGTGSYSGYAPTLKIYWHDDNTNSDRLLGTKTVKSLSTGASSSLTKEVTVTHKVDGSLSGYAKAVWTKNTSASYVPASGTVQTTNTALTKIPRASTINSGKLVTISNNAYPSYETLEITSATTTFKHKLEYSFSDKSGKLLSGVIADNFSISKGINVVFDKTTPSVSEYVNLAFPLTLEELLSKEIEFYDISKDIQGKIPITYKLSTYDENGTLLGTDSKTYDWHCSRTKSSITFDSKLETIDALSKELTGTTDIFIKSISQIKASFYNLKLSDEAQVYDYIFDLNDAKNIIKEGNKIYDAIDLENATFGFQLRDTRGSYTDIKTKKLSTIEDGDYKYLNYNGPSIKSVIVEREEPTSKKVNISCNGTFWNNNFGLKQNVPTLKYRYKLNSNEYSEYKNAECTVSENSFNFNGTLDIELLEDSEVTVEFVVTDLALKSDSLSDSETKSQYMMALTDGYANFIGMLCINDELVPAYILKDKDKGIVQLIDHNGKNIFPETGLFKKIGTFEEEEEN